MKERIPHALLHTVRTPSFREAPSGREGPSGRESFAGASFATGALRTGPLRPGPLRTGPLRRGSYFTLPAVRPPTRRFSMSMNRMTTGRIATIETPNTYCQLVSY